MKPCPSCGGNDRYPSGPCKPCTKRRHQEWRKTAKGREAERQYRATHKTEMAAYQQRWYQINRERDLARSRAHYWATREQQRERGRKWRDANPDKIAAKNERYRQLYAERMRESERRWRENNPEAYREIRRKADQRRRVRGRVPSVEYVDIIELDPCSYCGGPSEAIDHIDAVFAGGNHEWTNLTAACRSCNSRKNVYPLLFFLLRESQRATRAQPLGTEQLRLSA